MKTSEDLLRVYDLTVRFGSGAAAIRAVNHVSFHVPRGAAAALVGESGCGKTVTALALARLLPQPPAVIEGGEILLDGEEVLDMPPARLRALRRSDISYVFQEPGAALNPVMRVGDQIAEAVRAGREDVDAMQETLRLMDLVRLPGGRDQARSYPHEMSGGMKQRVMIAMALASRPRLLVADEPTTALDVTIQAQVFDLVRELLDDLGMAMLLITHNLGVVADTARVVHVMYAGRVVESGPVDAVLGRPAHPYTRGLLASVPRLTGKSAAAPLQGIEGSVPHPADLPPGCSFAPRCPLAAPDCGVAVPASRPVGPDHAASCLFAG